MFGVFLLNKCATLVTYKYLVNNVCRAAYDGEITADTSPPTLGTVAQRAGRLRAGCRQMCKDRLSASGWF